MIQRIQTLYLFLAVVLGTLLCFFPPVQLITPEGAEQFRQYEFTFAHVVDITNPESPVNVMNIISLSIIAVAIPMLALIDIFLFKKRILQARLNVITVVLCLGYYAILATYIWFAKTNLQTDWYLTIWAAMPLLCLVLILMATRRILHDEALVRAADRIR